MPICSQVSQLAKDINPTAFKNMLPSNQWFNRFRKRHELQLKSCKSKSSFTATQCELLADTGEAHEALFQRYVKVIAQNTIRPYGIYNVDTAEFADHHKEFSTSSSGGGGGAGAGNSQKEITSIAVCANATGTVIIPPFIIFKDDDGSTSAPLSGILVAYSKSGRMTAETFDTWLTIFVEQIPRERPVLLMLDDRVSHVTFKAMKMARDNGVILFCLPPRVSSHTYRPMDAGVFKALRSKFQESAGRTTQDIKLSRRQFAEVLARIWSDCVNASNIKAGFQRSGLWPINKFLVCTPHEK